MSDKKTYLVLGANGFIGSYLVERLAEDTNVSVRAFDRFSSQPKFEITENIEVFKGDLASDSDLEKAITGVDYILHSFSVTTPFISDNDPYIDITGNLLRSVKVFDLAAKHTVKKVGFISSGGAVYGSLAEQKTAVETDRPLPVSPYGINKLSIEHYLEYFKRKHGTPYVAYRLTNPYGPRQIVKYNQGVIPAFLSKIRDGQDITIYGDGTSSRDYVYIKDAARMITTSFEAQTKHSVYNIGSGHQTSLNDIIAAVAKVTGKEPSVSFKQAPETFLAHTSVSVERFTSEFGAQELTTLESGLQQTLASRQ
jgi:UDP-glucose 4-epimerase